MIEQFSNEVMIMLLSVIAWQNRELKPTLNTIKEYLKNLIDKENS